MIRLVSKEKKKGSERERKRDRQTDRQTERNKERKRKNGKRELELFMMENYDDEDDVGKDGVGDDERWRWIN